MSAVRREALGITVEGMLSTHFADETISGYECSNPACGHINYRLNPRTGRREFLDYNARKQSCLIHLPPVLVLHIRRSDFYATMGYTAKASVHVDFDWTLNMKPFTLEGREARSPLTAVGGGVGSGGGRAPDPRFVYDLMAVVQHLGTSGGGHYVTYRRVTASVCDPDNVAPQWVRASDASIESVSGEQVLDAEAYMLFYCRRDTRLSPRIQAAVVAVDSIDSAMQRSSRAALLQPPPLLMQSSLQAAMAHTAHQPDSRLLRQFMAHIWSGGRIQQDTKATAGSGTSVVVTERGGNVAAYRHMVAVWIQRMGARLVTQDGSSGEAVELPHAQLVWYPTE